MKNINIILALAACALLSPACKFISAEGLSDSYGKSGEKVTASGNLVTKSFEISEFTAIETKLPCDISYSAGEPGLSVYTSDNIIDKISFDIDAEGTLVIDACDGYRFRNLKTLKIRLSSATLKEVAVKGAADIEIEGGLVSDSFSISIDGSADIDIASIKTDSLEAEINGAGDIDIENLVCGTASVSIKGSGDCTLSGKAERVDVEIKGAGDVDLSELQCYDVTSSIKGAGSVERYRD